jgi:hypothetical protein
MQHCIDNLEVNGGVVVEGKRNGGEEALVSRWDRGSHKMAAPL